MTTDREAACWLMAALLVVVLTFSAAGCGTRPPSTDAAEAPFAAAAPSPRWTIGDEADALPTLVAAAQRASRAERDRAAALGFDGLAADAAAQGVSGVPLLTLEQAAQLDAVVVPARGDLVPAVNAPAAPAEAEAGAEAAARAGAHDAWAHDAAALGAGGALTDAARRGLRGAAAAAGRATPGQIALGLVAAVVLAFGLQVWALAQKLRDVPFPGPRLTLGPGLPPAPRPPAGGAARPLPFAGAAAFGVPRLARAA